MGRRMNFDIPKFDGIDALGWIFAMDQYFDLCSIPLEEQISIVTFHMQGVAIPWFQMSQRMAPFQSWIQLKRAVEIEFGPSLYESPCELLFKLHQTGHNPRVLFGVHFFGQSHIEPHDALRDYFISSLRSDLKQEVKAQCPSSLMWAISLARLYEDKFSPVNKATFGPNRYHPNHNTQKPPVLTRPPPNNGLPPLLPIPHQLAINTKQPVKRLTPTEQQHRRELGLCFLYNDNFTNTQVSQPTIYVVSTGNRGEFCPKKMKQPLTTVKETGMLFPS